MLNRPYISIVVAAYTNKRLNDLCDLLHSIDRQTFTSFEVVCVVGHSQKLLSELQKYVKSHIKSNVRFVFNPGDYKLNIQRNIGIEKSIGDIIAFVDDDAVLSAEWAKGVVEGFKNNEVVGITGPAHPLWESDDLSWLPKEFWWVTACTGWFNITRTHEVRNALGMNMAFRKSAFEQAGKFNTSIGMRGKKGLVIGEVELSLRIREETGKKIIFVPRMAVKHKVKKYRTTFKFMSQRAYSIGKGKVYIKKIFANSNVSKDILNPEAQLLKRITLKLLPQILLSLIKNPRIGFKQLTSVILIITYTGLGFCVAYMHSVINPNSFVLNAGKIK